jgi:CRISPR-associated protein Csb2
MAIAVQIEFLVIPHLTDPAAPRWAEWPPAPDRVFQALVASAAECHLDWGVLRYLEAAPAIAASEALRGRAPQQYVPENFRRGSGYHQGTERYLPTAQPVSPLVTYLWERVPDEAVTALSPIVASITHIGRASSLVAARLVDPGSVTPDWLPHPRGETPMRVPYAGRLDDLYAAHGAGLPGPTAPMQGYRRAERVYPSAGWGELMALRPERQLDTRQTPHWTDRIRRAVMSQAPADMPALIHGHGDDRHVAWAAIPDVGHPYASGGILGLGCWLPADVTPAERGLLGASLMRVTELDGIRLELDSVGLKGLQPATWSRPARRWASVTPIALDRWPKKRLTAETILGNTLQRMGLPAPLSIECPSYSPVKGSPHASRYPARRGNRFVTHAIIEWHGAIAGPLLIGADRFFGGGLCRPWSGDGGESTHGA